MSKPKSRSRTIIFNVILGAFEGALGVIHVLEPVLSPVQFAVVMLALTTIHTAGGVYLRTITTGPVQ